jgi:hypothetical protein
MNRSVSLHHVKASDISGGILRHDDGRVSVCLRDAGTQIHFDSLADLYEFADRLRTLRVKGLAVSA